MPGFLSNIGTTELAIIIFILTLIFGRKLIVSLGKTSGETVKEIKKIKKSITEAIEDDEPRKKEG